MPSQKNTQQLQLIKDKVSQAKSVAIVDYSGSDVKAMTELRSDVKEAGGEVFITKNSLVKLALGQKALDESLDGMNALVLSYDDEVAAIKATFAFHEKTDLLDIKQGLMADKVLSIEEVEALSNMPGRQELLATLINHIQGPANGLVNVMKASQRSLVQVLKAISSKESN